MRRIHPRDARVASLAVVGLFPASGQVPAENEGVQLASHRAIYDLKLAEARGRRQLSAVQGRIVYDFSGSSCEGYALQFRQVTELDNGEGKMVVSDLRSATWEEGAAKNYRFNFQNYLSQKLVDSVDGKAERGTGAIAVNLAKPESKQFDVEQGVVFPTEHIRRIVVAARQGKTVLEVPVYDGSETGEKLYNTLTVDRAADSGRPAQARRRGCRQRRSGIHAAMAGDDQLFRPFQAGRRATAGLHHQVRALRERRVARPAARLRRFRHPRHHEHPGAAEHPALPVGRGTAIA